MRSIYLIIIVLVLIIGALIFLPSKSSQLTAVNNVTIEDGKQVINITARGGYEPRVTTAKAGISTIIKVTTNNTFDCSSALVIPSLNFRQNLPPAGVTEVSVPAQITGTKLQGLCAMGMYRFDINFI